MRTQTCEGYFWLFFGSNDILFVWKYIYPPETCYISFVSINWANEISDSLPNVKAISVASNSIVLCVKFSLLHLKCHPEVLVGRLVIHFRGDKFGMSGERYVLSTGKDDQSLSIHARPSKGRRATPTLICPVVQTRKEQKRLCHRWAGCVVTGIEICLFLTVGGEYPIKITHRRHTLKSKLKRPVLFLLLCSRREESL